MKKDIGPAPKIPFVEALRVEMTGRAHVQILPPLVEMIKIDEFPVIPELRAHDWEYHAFAQVGFKQIAPQGAADVVRKHGIRAICHHIYGPIEAELRLVQEDLWRSGLPSSSPVAQRIERLIAVLRGESVD